MCFSDALTDSIVDLLKVCQLVRTVIVQYDVIQNYLAHATKLTDGQTIQQHRKNMEMN